MAEIELLMPATLRGVLSAYLCTPSGSVARRAPRGGSPTSLKEGAGLRTLLMTRRKSSRPGTRSCCRPASRSARPASESRRAPLYVTKMPSGSGRGRPQR